MDEIWERAVETALDEQTGGAGAGARALTLDGAVKCVHGRLPPPELLERFQSLEHLSIANVGVSSLEKFPRLPNLQKLILSDNRIAGGLEFLVGAGLASLRDLDLSNNRIQFVEDLAPLAQLKLVSLDLYECPVTRVKDYRSRVFGLIRSLKYLDKMDADENERPESDDDDEDDDDDDDPGSGEVDGEDRSGKSINGGASEGILDVDEDDESDADEEETEAVRSRIPNGSNHGGGASASNELSNGFGVASTAGESNSIDGDEEDVEDEDEDDLVEEIDEGDDDDVVEVHDIEDSDEDEDGVEEDDDEDDDDEDDDVEDDEEYAEPGSTGRLTSVEGEIDGHDQGEESENGEIGDEEEQGVEEDVEYEEDDEENGDEDNGEIGEENEQGVEENCEYEEEDGDGEDEEEDFGSEYLVQPIGQVEEEAGGSDFDPGNDDEAGEEEVEDEDDRHQAQPQPLQLKRRRDGSDSNDKDGIEDPRPLKDSKHH